MIFVILGTQDKPFTRLLEALEELKKKKRIKEDIIVQAGYTKYNSKYMKIFDYIPMDEFETYIKKADLIITHGGAGSILTSLKQKKKVIAVPRLSKYGEHTNDHQLQIIEELEKEKYILSCMDLSKLEEAYQQSKTFHPKKYQPDNKKMIDTIEQYIERTNHKNHSLLIIGGILFIIGILLYLIF